MGLKPPAPHFDSKAPGRLRHRFDQGLCILAIVWLGTALGGTLSDRSHLAGVLGDTGTLSLEAGVHLLTARPAEVFGIRDRGRLAEGLAADITVFDPDQVGCSPLRRVRDLPGGADRLVSDAIGVEAVIVNGRV